MRRLRRQPTLAPDRLDPRYAVERLEPRLLLANVNWVGGASGNLLAEILMRHNGPRGILADLPHVVKDAPALLEAKGVAGRVAIEAHDFFKSVPKGGDAYILSHVIHDWSEAQCLTILANLHKAMKPEARLLLVEMVLPGKDEPHFGKILDMVMLATGMRESFASLLGRTGFTIRVSPRGTVPFDSEAT